jgi:hypothetical protein
LGCALGQTPTTLPVEDYPADWPPLPDFKTPVDYVAWFMEQANQGITSENDAAPLWAEILESKDDSEDVRKEKDHMWGRTTDGRIPGLFTAYNRDRPENYAWDPDEHTDWAIANSFHRETGLIAKIIEISRKERCSPGNWLPNELDEMDKKVGFTQDDRLLLRMHVFTRMHHRTGVEVILQDGWRMEDGRVDAKRLLDSIQATLRIAYQFERNPLNWNDPFNGMMLRGRAYTSAIRAIHEQVFTPEDIATLARWLSRYDRKSIDWTGCIARDLARQYELLQYAYELDERSSAIRPNDGNVRKLVKLARAQYEKWPESEDAPLDIDKTIHQYDFHETITRVLTSSLALRRLAGLPGSLAIAKVRGHQDAFLADLDNHVLLRQFHYSSVPLRLIFGTEIEATRRATHLIYAIYRAKNKTGEWPASLRLLRPRVLHRTRTDPFSGQYFLYRIENGRPLLYSSAFNGKDDGGKHDMRWGRDEENRNTDYVFWPIPKKKN